VLVLDEPDNFLDLDGKAWLDDELRATKKTVLLVSHDRQLLSTAVDRILVIERNNSWIHGGTFATEVDDPAAPLLEIVAARYGNDESARKALGRYGLGGHVQHRLAELSGGQRARVQLVLLETERPNVLLLDEPTDNLDLESIQAIEIALSELEATLITISHDRSFAGLFDRFVLFDRDGLVAETDDRERALRIASTPGSSVLDDARLDLLTIG
jgi:ATPase subunit of ABC transporter with duplicated ATPase domains